MRIAVGEFADDARLVQDATGCSDCCSADTLGCSAATTAERMDTTQRATVGIDGIANASSDAGPADACARVVVAVCTTICYATDATHATDVGSGAGASAVCKSTTGTILRWIQCVQCTSCEPTRAGTVLLSTEWVDAHAWTRASVLTLHACSQF